MEDKIWNLLKQLNDLGQEIEHCEECPIINLCDIMVDVDCPFTMAENLIDGKDNGLNE